jgi:hypothetical protein
MQAFGVTFKDGRWTSTNARVNQFIQDNSIMSLITVFVSGTSRIIEEDVTGRLKVRFGAGTEFYVDDRAHPGSTNAQV